MSDPIHNKKFGGVNFNWNQVKSAEVKQKDGKKIYIVEFKSGIKVEYPEQKYGKMQSRELTMWQSFDYDTETILENVDNVKVTGSQKDDHIIGETITNSTINVANDKNNDDKVDIRSEIRKYKDGIIAEDLSENNTLILDKSDTATLSKITRIIGEDIRVKEKDIEGPGIDKR